MFILHEQGTEAAHKWYDVEEIMIQNVSNLETI